MTAIPSATADIFVDDGGDAPGRRCKAEEEEAAPRAGNAAGYGLLLCAGCAFAARQLAATGAERLACATLR
jgi:hypothetical protein